MNLNIDATNDGAHRVMYTRMVENRLQPGSSSTCGSHGPMMRVPRGQEKRLVSLETEMTAPSDREDDLKGLHTASEREDNGRGTKNWTRTEEKRFLPEDCDIEATDGNSEECNDQPAQKNGWDIISKTVLSSKACVFFLVILSFVGSFFIVVFIGAEVERMSYKDASTTEEYYQTPDVCAIKPNRMTAHEDFFALETYKNSSAAHASGCDVAHCGQCGRCSTADDIAIMARTKRTLTEDARNCGVRAFLGGRDAVERCMEEKVGFTPDCTDCWVDNVMCTKKFCAFTCLKSLYILREKNNPTDSDQLNSCLGCDEVMCGPEFIQCAGANRRRLGITSDIGRSTEKEQCKKVDVDWVHASEVGFSL